MTHAQRVVAVLGLVAEAVGRLTDRELTDLLAGRARLVVAPDIAAPAPPRSSGPAVAGRPASGLDDDAAAEVVAEVSAAADRAAGEAALTSRRLTKADLLAVAGAAGLTMPRSSTVAKLRTAIVEQLVGLRLRAEALRAGAPPSR